MLNVNDQSTSSGNPNSMYASYRSRLQTFVEFNRRYQRTEDFRALARSGFYYRALQQNMTCYFCGVVLSSTRLCYKRHMPQCAGRTIFNSVQKRRLENVPVVNFSDVRQPRESEPGTSTRGMDVSFSDLDSDDENESGLSGESSGNRFVVRNVSPNSELGQFILRNVETVMSSIRMNQPSSGTRHHDGLNGFTVDLPDPIPDVSEIVNGLDFAPSPLCPGYIRYEERLKSFHDWPPSMTVDKHALCSAGFFYTGTNDQVACYYCGFKRNGWIPTDDPWRIHALHVPQSICYSVAPPRTICHFILMSRGERFIEEVRSGVDADQPDEPTTSSSQNGAPPTAPTPPINFSNNKPCVVCCEESSDVVFEPCSHIVSCYKCAVGQPTCFVCRQKIVRLRKVYFG